MKKVMTILSVTILTSVMANAADMKKAESTPAHDMIVPMTAGELFNKLDADHDGSISKLEFLEAQPVMPPQMQPSMPPRMDRGGDVPKSPYPEEYQERCHS